MEDYRSAHATPGQIDSLWAMIGSMRRQIEELSERLNRMEEGPAEGSLSSAAAHGAGSSIR